MNMNKNIIFLKKSINCIKFKELYKKNTINNLGYVKLIKEEKMKDVNINKCNNNSPYLITDKYKVTFNLSNNTQKTYKAIYYKEFGQLFFYHP
jgi:hypothetical protein